MSCWLIHFWSSYANHKPVLSKDDPEVMWSVVGGEGGELRKRVITFVNISPKRCITPALRIFAQNASNPNRGKAETVVYPE